MINDGRTIRDLEKQKFTEGANDEVAVNISNIQNVGSIQVIRDGVSTSDSSNPTIGTGEDFSGYQYVELEITIGGTSTSWDVTPLLVNSAEDAYMEGETITFTGPKTHVQMIQVNGSSDVNFRVDNSLGTSPTITIKGKGFN